jgi:hypothetical protein
MVRKENTIFIIPLPQLNNQPLFCTVNGTGLAFDHELIIILIGEAQIRSWQKTGASPYYNMIHIHVSHEHLDLAVAESSES